MCHGRDCRENDMPAIRYCSSVPVCSRTRTTPTPDATAVVVTARNDAGESQLTLKVRVNAAESLVALGGEVDSYQSLNSCEVYDPASNSWRAIAPMGSKRHGMAAAVVSIG